MAKKALLPALLRRALCAWLGAAALEYLLQPAAKRGLFHFSALEGMSLPRLLGVGAVLFLALCLGGLLLARKSPAGAERAARAARLLPLLLFALMAGLGLAASFRWSLLGGCLLVGLLLGVYAWKGWQAAPERVPLEGKPCTGWAWLTALMALGFFAAISAWGVARVRNLSAPSYDFGIFAQMFHYMRRTGAPLTTLERDGLLSHFRVHLSPIYYLMLPFYLLAPRPETLQVLQAAVMASAVIPLWKLGRLHGLTGPRRFLLCALLLLAPAFSGGASFDLHENCFLTPLLLWLLWALDRGNRPVGAAAALLTLCVKEDAAVYVAAAGLYTLLRAALRPSRRQQLPAGLLLLGGALLYFALATAWLAKAGDGVMVDRYANLIYEEGGGLLCVVKAVLLCPIKALFECFEPEKLPYVGLTLGAMLGIPLWTRRYERLTLLIPWVLIHLLSGYVYQHDVFYQYSFGSLAFLLYLCCVNLQPAPQDGAGRAEARFPLRAAALALAVLLSAGCLWKTVFPVWRRAVSRALHPTERVLQIRAMLERIPAQDSVTASTFYTVPLSGRAELYDLGYAELSHLLDSDWVAASLRQDTDRFATETESGPEALDRLLTANGFHLEEELPGVLRLYRK